MTTIRKIKNTPTTAGVDFKFITKGPMAATAAVCIDRDASVQVTIDSQWFYAEDLRHAAKLFNRLADNLDAGANAG